MKRHGIWVAGFIALGCSHSDSPVAPAQQVEDKQPARIEVTVTVDVPDLSRPAYGISLDGKHLINIPTNTTVPLVVEGGHHTISVEHTIGGAPASDACRNTGLDAVSGVYPAGQTSSVGFYFHCAPLVANARLTLAISAAGSNIPKAVPVVINRDAFPPYQLLVDAPVGDTRTYSVPLGLYFIQLGPGNCVLSSGVSAAVAFIMDTRPTGVTLRITCT